MDRSLTQPDLPPRRCTEPQSAAEQNNSVGHSISLLEQNKYYCPAEAGKLSLVSANGSSRPPQFYLRFSNGFITNVV